MEEDRRKTFLLSKSDAKMIKMDHSKCLCGYNAFSHCMGFEKLEYLFDAMELDDPLLGKAGVSILKRVKALLSKCNWDPSQAIPENLWYNTDVGMYAHLTCRFIVFSHFV
jgi:hypothetical protein